MVEQGVMQYLSKEKQAVKWRKKGEREKLRLGRVRVELWMRVEVGTRRLILLRDKSLGLLDLVSLQY